MTASVTFNEVLYSKDEGTFKQQLIHSQNTRELVMGCPH